MSSVLNEILEWGRSLPGWEQAALAKILERGDLGASDYDEILQCLLEDAGLGTASTPRTPFACPQPQEAPQADGNGGAKLVSLSSLENVNALVPGQKLTFGPHLTTIYGENGCGKSGYARVIASTSFSRGDRQVLKDIAKPDDGSSRLARIELETGGETETLHCEIGQAHPRMQCFYVFDSTSVRAHLTQANPMSFAPAGLDCLTRLAEVTDAIRARLDDKVKQQTPPNAFLSQFQGESEVARVLARLDDVKDDAELRRLAEMTPEEVQEASTLDRKIAELKADRVPEQISRLDKDLQALPALVSSLRAAESALDDAAVSSVNQSIGRWQDLSLAASRLSSELFKTSGLEHVGGAAWHEFAKAARHLASVESRPGGPYPQPGAPCLLCQQPLSPEAEARLTNLWAFLEGGAQAERSRLETGLQVLRTKLQGLERSVPTQDSEFAGRLRESAPALAETVRVAVQDRRDRIALVLVAIESKEPAACPPLAPISWVEFAGLESRLQGEKAELVSRDPGAHLAALEKKRLELAHRVHLQKVLGDLQRYLADMRWVKKASSPKVRGNTKHITQKYSELFTRLVTERYVEHFEELLHQLNCPMRVQVATQASKGSTSKRLTLRSDPTVKADPQKVLSEGEQRAIALADFLTELALDEASAGVILDDPVTSLDFRWKETIARHLAELAQTRQVILFTHDLHFLYCLKEAADTCEVPTESHWIQRRDDQPGWVFLDNSPTLEEDYKKPDRAKKFLEKAKDAPPEEQETALRNGFGALRTCYEAFVIFNLFSGAVRRFQETVSVGRLENILWDSEIVDEVVAASGRLSRHIEAHSHSDLHGGVKPTPRLLQDEIEAFEALRRKNKARRKQAGFKD